VAIQSFRDQASVDIWEGTDSKAARKALPKTLWSSASAKLDLLDGATDLLKDLGAPGLRLKKLTGDQAGRWSIRINDQYRITFRFDGGHAHDVLVEDYH